MTTTQSTMPMQTQLERYKKKLLAVLNASLAWNIVKLPKNTFDLQLKKYEEECDEAVEAEQINYQRLIEELADVLISIGGMMRFNPELAIDMLNQFLDCKDKFILMDVVDYAEEKLPLLYERSYSDGYHHDEVIQ